ncbi:hypothetical protein CSA56_07380 [candidate division KSB3 bacterium]|uniref:DUF1456 domain-containing protein n=1 Tax=candidate division KSB3 bacterium TaxID=2044937 RepID=A0A2G6KFX4_9BACT|nr:MAG: hypothetical protein CSA56_07380 [candidate division KSB3 bacterium]
MTNNDVLRRVRYALDIPDALMIKIFSLADRKIDRLTVQRLLKKDGDDGHLACSEDDLTAFLDGLIVLKRGKQEKRPGRLFTLDAPLDNNMILRKLRIALELRDDEMLQTLALAGFDVSKSELSALFRKKGHRHYKTCGDQFLRNFLNGLTRRYRNPSSQR